MPSLLHDHTKERHNQRAWLYKRDRWLDAILNVTLASQSRIVPHAKSALNAMQIY